MTQFQSLVPFIKERLTKHHELYSSQCKAENWEEILAYALKQCEFGSDWKPDFNHKSGVDQTTDKGIRIGNKSGTLELDCIEISGSRLTKHKTLQDKLEFLSDRKEDYILCLGVEKKDKKNWVRNVKRYYFVVIDSQKLNYHEQSWTETYGVKGALKGKVNGWSCQSDVFSAKINKSMSDQLWTEIKLDHCEEIYDITIG
jgi:hypothetical protein